jgi:Protein of unknown function (DUF2958)
MNIREEVEARLGNVPLYSQEANRDPTIYCKLFHAYGSGTWYLTEYDSKDIAFGYVTGLVENEWGYVAISELEALHLCGAIPRIECDLSFEPTPFSQLRVKGLV